MNSAKKQFPTLMLVLCALFAALMAIGAWISIPMSSGISVTLQLMAIMTCAALMRPMYAALSVTAYALIGLVGLPVFSNFSGGPGVLLGVTGGYIIGFIPAAFLTSLIIHRWGREVWKQALAMVLGVLVCYAFGSLWFMISLKRSLGQTLALCVIPYIPFDLIKIAVAVLLSKSLYQPMQSILRRNSR